MCLWESNKKHLKLFLSEHPFLRRSNSGLEEESFLQQIPKAWRWDQRLLFIDASTPDEQDSSLFSARLHCSGCFHVSVQPEQPIRAWKVRSSVFQKGERCPPIMKQIWAFQSGKDPKDQSLVRFLITGRPLASKSDLSQWTSPNRMLPQSYRAGSIPVEKPLAHRRASSGIQKMNAENPPCRPKNKFTISHLSGGVGENIDTLED